MLARVGKVAPDFEAPGYISGTFKPVKLSDHGGKWIVLCFYPGDFTYVCPTELAALAVRHATLSSLGVEVLAISTDSSEIHKKWHDEELARMVEGGIPFPILSDAGGRIGEAYGLYDAELGVDIRGWFLIDPDMVIRAMEVLTPEVGRNPDELIRQIKAFQRARATREVTPSGWMPGQQTLTPGPDLAGKVWKVWKP